MAELALPTTPEEFAKALKAATEAGIQEGAKKASAQAKAKIEELKEKVTLATPPKSGGLKVKLSDGFYVINTLGNINLYDRDTKVTTTYKAEDLAKNVELCQKIVDRGSDLIVKLNEK